MQIYTHERLYHEIVPINSDLQRISLLQSRLRLPNGARLIALSKLHLTIIHFGKLKNVFDEIASLNPQLEHETYLRLVSAYVERTKNILPVSVQLSCKGYAMFGVKKTVLALIFKPDKALLQAHQKALQHLLVLFSASGITDPMEFMSGSHNFRYALSLRPHLTLAKNVVQIDTGSLPTPPTNTTFTPAALHGL